MVQQTMDHSVNLSESLHSLAALIRKHEDFEKLLAAHRETIENLDNTASKLIGNDHYASESIDIKRSKVIKKRDYLLELCTKKRAHLQFLYKLQQFEQECVEIRLWVTERIEVTKDSSYVDLDDLSKRHEIFEDSLIAYRLYIDEVISRGHHLIEDDSYGAENRIRESIRKLEELWQHLKDGTERKKEIIAEVNEEHVYNVDVSEFQYWIIAVEDKLRPQQQDTTDLSELQQLQKNLDALEAEINDHRNRLKELIEKATDLEYRGHHNTTEIITKKASVIERFNALNEPLSIRKKQIGDILALKSLFGDIEEQEEWIKEKMAVASSTEEGRDFFTVQKLNKKHTVLMSEIKNHEERILSVCHLGKNMAAEGKGNREAINGKVTKLHENWIELNEKAEQRKVDLSLLIEAHQYLSDANDAESWMGEKKQAISSEDIGKNLMEIETLLKKHVHILHDIDAFQSTMDSLHRQAKQCNLHEVTIINTVGKDFGVARYDFKPSLLSFREVAMKKDDPLIITNVDNKEWWKVEVNNRNGYVPKSYIRRTPAPSDLSGLLTFLTEKVHISSRQKHIEYQYEVLKAIAQQAKDRLQDALRFYSGLTDLSSWINEKITLLSNFHISDVQMLDELDAIQNKFDEFQCLLKEKERLLPHIKEAAEEYKTSLESRAADKLQIEIEDLNTAWGNLQIEAQDKEFQLKSAYELQRFNKVVDETDAMMKDKDTSLDVEDTGTDLESLEELQRKHDGVERDIKIIKDKILLLEDTGKMKHMHPASAQVARAKQEEMTIKWKTLQAKARARKLILVDAYQLHRFIALHNELLVWLQSMLELVSTTELGLTVPEAESHVQTHQEYRTEIDARKESFTVVEELGEKLVESKHFASEQIQKHLHTLGETRESFESQYLMRKQQLCDCLQLQLFFRDCDHAEEWMGLREEYLQEKTLIGVKDPVQIKSENLTLKEETKETTLKSTLGITSKISTILDY